MLYYTAADKNHQGMLCCKISSSDTVAVQQRFWQKQCTWWKDISTFGGQISEDRNWDRCRQRPTLFIFQHNSWEYSKFTGHHEESPWKPTCCLSQETGISTNSLLRILHDDLKLFPYKIQILQRQTDQNKAEQETFCKDIIRRIENDPGLILTIWMMSTTAAFVGHLLHFLSPEIWPPNDELSFYQVHCSCQNLFCIVTVSEELILWQSMPWWFLSPAM